MALLKLNPLIKRVLLFCVLFMILSGIIGPWVIRTKLLYGFHFFIYGNMGKVLLIGAIALFFLIKDKIAQLSVPDLKKGNFALIASTFLLIPVFFMFARALLLYSEFNAQNLPLGLATHGILLLSVVLLGLGVFSWGFIKDFARQFKRELLICLALAVFMYFMIFQVWKLWTYFSDVVLQITYALLSLTFPNVHITLPRTLALGNFAVIIDQACSGLDSLFLFTCLYWFFGFVDWKEFNKKKLVLMYLPAAVGLFLVNVLRIYLLMVIGFLVSRELALELFHTYAGMVLFIVYFLGFWKVSYKWLKSQ